MIRNVTRDVLLEPRAKPVRSFFAQALGLMFRRPLDREGWVFLLPWSGSWDVTNLFVFQTIDVLWLDKERSVLQKATVKPWTRRVKGVSGTWYLIELPAGACAGTRVGDRLSWSFEKKRI